MSLDNPPEIISETHLPTMDAAKARELMREKEAQIKANERKKYEQIEAQQGRPKRDPAITECQMKVLSRAYPETIKLMREKNPQLVREVYEAYKRETLAVTGIQIEKLKPDDFINRQLNHWRKKYRG